MMSVIESTVVAMEQQLTSTAGVTTLTTGDVGALCALVAGLPVASSSSEMVDQLDVLERLKCAAAAAQAEITQTLDRERVGVHARSISAEIGLARHESPHAARNLLTLARGLRLMPHTAAALAAGDLSERRAQIIVNETEDLEAEDRSLLDECVPEMFLGLGDRRLRDGLRELILQFDDRLAAQRHRKAVSRRHLTVKPLGDGMSQLTAIVPSERVPSMIGSLDAEAMVIKAEHPEDERTQPQRMLDVFMARLSGVAEGEPQPVATKIVIPAEALTGNTSVRNAEVSGIGPIGMEAAIDLLCVGLLHPASTVQRLFVAPESGALVATERPGRFHPKDLADLIRLRDRETCRTPWCNAPIRQIDHPRPAAMGGDTSQLNGAGLCVSCNLAKEAVGWRHDPSADDHGRHSIEIITPTGHRHRSTEPGFSLPRVRRRPTVDYVIADDFTLAG